MGEEICTNWRAARRLAHGTCFSAKIHGDFGRKSGPLRHYYMEIGSCADQRGIDAANGRTVRALLP